MVTVCQFLFPNVSGKIGAREAGRLFKKFVQQGGGLGSTSFIIDETESQEVGQQQLIDEGTIYIKQHFLHFL